MISPSVNFRVSHGIAAYILMPKGRGDAAFDNVKCQKGWSHERESNPQRRLGKPKFYR